MAAIEKQIRRLKNSTENFAVLVSFVQPFSVDSVIYPPAIDQ